MLRGNLQKKDSMNEDIIDTNFFIRLFTKQPSHQYKKAYTFFKEIEDKKTKGCVSILVINEVIWILERSYKIPRLVYLPKLIHLILLPNISIIEVEKKTLVSTLQRMMTISIDFTDIYLFEIANGRTIISFDKDFKKLKN